MSEDSKTNKLKEFYVKHYKKLLIIPIVLLILALMQLGFQHATTGDFISKGVSLKGGLVVTVPTDEFIDQEILENALRASYPERDINIKSITEAGKQMAVIIEADITDKDESNTFLDSIEEETNVAHNLFNVEMTGSSLGKSFFKDILFALLIAFVFMGVVVFIYFRTLVPSFAVILAAFSDMVVTLAIVNIMGMKLSTAGIVAFLLLIGYSVDTDILLTVRVLKRKEGHYMDRIFSSIKTGLTMNLTTLAAVTVALIVSKSEVITQIMTILLIGLIIDSLNTWIQNVGILRLYMEYKEKKAKKHEVSTE
ncbi:protein translocase subunit SecF [Candidatus Woesearchaeota archaeon]|jgi:preprotein translocase subunit SecF|nr:protein translocase subunit SecF [Candidatus Woesearchaeota archaeon]MBT5272687.1 protein translocase subunit SecF [Candidatus Woesearchaeota archaeon]MBT6040298.1 protein translocase subunit SecF [Candidatus Woesearchaeota archaeon]MBT6337068.1 protein translocase subunit SecF [Candidatus Woesearchaeota archaeon]MBT7927878.1 protein translocase subunit SecF [Candidatus Woesearchaeota archaeon]